MVQKSPVLVLTFNRPDTTALVMAEIARYQPPEIFLFSDGPRPGRVGERELVDATRQVMEDSLSWGPQVHRLYRDENQGLFRGVTGALDWFFSHVEEGIILEDDCVPHPDFFAYCDELLERYRHDERVWCVSGDNSVDLPIAGDASYGFIRDPLIWGWATWRRAWQNFDHTMSNWTQMRRSAEFARLFPDRVERRVRRESFDHYLAGVDAWAFKWKYTVQTHGGLVAVPRVNLVSNIGWNRPDATHTTGSSMRAGKPVHAILPLVHPSDVRIDQRASQEFVESRGLGVKKYRLTYQAGKALRRFRRRLGKVIGR